MKFLNILLFSTLCLVLINCRNKNDINKNVFSIDGSKLKEQYFNFDIVEITLKNPDNKKIDSLVYYINNKKIESKKGFNKVIFSLKDQKLGYQNLKVIIFYEGKKEIDTTRIEIVASVITKKMNYSIINIYPHDITSFTEGLEFFKDTLYESTGSGNRSTFKSYFRKYDYKTGKVYKQINLEQPYFGEGITIIDDKLFQLTWQNKTGFVYNVNSLKREKKFKFNKNIEGWGMTNDGKNIYQSDGTEKIWKMNPKTQKIYDYINVYTGGSKVKSVNELEWIDGKIFANIWQKDAIAIINPISGAVEGVLDMSNLKKSVMNKNADVLNGIAYNAKSKTIFVTGKNWDKIFEIKVK